jgi:hypothetical protein
MEDEDDYEDEDRDADHADKDQVGGLGGWGMTMAREAED